MIQITEKSKCNGCQACFNVCPKKCISMTADSEGFWYPQVDASTCVSCGLCERVCPILSESNKKNDVKETFAAINNDETIRLKSSSGGVFTALAENVLKNGGIVFGAAFSDDFKSVVHTEIASVEEIYKLQGSKYVQSDINRSYTNAKEHLEKGKTVLFSGTPCQIAGLYGYLGKDYDNLYTQDIICHGVPSPAVWKEYVELREMAASANTENVFFRSKKTGWATFSLQFKFDNGAEYSENTISDLYLRGFLSNLYLRPSCYDCAFKGLDRWADITLADFWGVDKVLDGFNDKKGTSLIIVNSPKGKALFENIHADLKMKAVDINQAVAYNSAATRSVKCPEARKKFFDELKVKDFSKVMNKYCGIKTSERIKRNIKRMIKKILGKG